MRYTRLTGFAIAALLALASGLAGAASSPLQPKTGAITTENLVDAGACTAGGCVEADVAAAGSVTVQVTGTYTAAGGLTAQVTTDGVNWINLCSSTCTTTFTRASTGATSAAITSGEQDIYQVPATGYKRIRITALGAVTGTATVTIQPTELVPSGFASISGGAGDASAANQTTMIASLSVLDDWDETDRAKVNVIVGQAGVAAGAGAVGATVVRTTQASDSPLVAAIGAAADAAATQGSTGTVSAKLREISASLGTINTSLGTVNTSINASTSQLPADGTGQVTMANSFPVVLASDQSAIPLHGHGATGAAVPANVTAMGARAGANSVNVAQGSNTVAINVSTATTTELVALSGSTQVRVTGLAVIAGGTGNITFVYGTGTACGTGTTSLSGAIPLIANAGLTIGGGLGSVLVAPAGQALCITTSAAVQMSGFLTFSQF